VRKEATITESWKRPLDAFQFVGITICSRNEITEACFKLGPTNLKYLVNKAQGMKKLRCNPSSAT
jgi:hypothetical protein